MIATNIKKLRLSNGLSQAELSKMSGVPQTTISDWEGGLLQNHPVLKAISLSKALSTTVEQLFPVADDN